MLLMEKQHYACGHLYAMQTDAETNKQTVRLKLDCLAACSPVALLTAPQRLFRLTAQVVIRCFSHSQATTEIQNTHPCEKQTEGTESQEIRYCCMKKRRALNSTRFDISGSEIKMSLVT